MLSSQPKTMPVSAAAPQLSDAPALGASGTSSPSPRAASSVTSAVPSSGASAVVVVDVAGKVARPGVYRLPSGSRIDDALRAAGGARRGVDLTSLNLASVLVDGQQIAVGRPGAVPAAGQPVASGAAPSAANGLVDLNTATLEQLDDLPGIGPALSQRILDYRTEHGSFTGVDQLDDVSGIGSVTFEKLKSLVTV